ncbi:AMIN domain-containing protein [Campylobacter californiensis]|uniref:AMIN domain-containing protein n=1 Tax=Campylobacter californiensis TaxID=1032243 RepID=UPI001474EB14|nr:AMIN domain-containing protein [Campylobacter sp. RM12916]MBE3609732.1 AMIN domain-containing protein [Campylobacter sp. RM12916]
MKKICIIFCLMASVLYARENPFTPIGELNASVMTTNLKEEFGEFDTQDIKFPSDARLLLGVTVRYRAGDGSIKEKVLSDINKTISWQEEYAILKLKNPEPLTTQKLDVSVTMPNPTAKTIIQTISHDKNDTNTTTQSKSVKSTRQEQAITTLPAVTTINLDTNKSKVGLSVKAKTQPKSKQVTTNKPKIQPKKQPSSLKFADMFEIDSSKNILKIITKDKNIKYFSHENSKIVLDFDNPPKSFRTKYIKVNSALFKNITVGWHDDFYRVVVELDKKRTYSIGKVMQGYELRVK